MKVKIDNNEVTWESEFPITDSDRVFLIYNITNEPKDIGLGVMTTPSIQPFYRKSDRVQTDKEVLEIPDDLDTGVYIAIVILGNVLLPAPPFPPETAVTKTDYEVFEINREVAEEDEMDILKNSIIETMREAIEQKFEDVKKYNNRTQI